MRYARRAFPALAAGAYLSSLKICLAEKAARLTFGCAPENDLYQALTHAGASFPRYPSAAEAVTQAPERSGVLILADAYPQQTTPLAPELFAQAARKNLRLFVEYPSFLPGLAVGAPRGVHWERAVVASEVFAPALARLRILAIHDCRFVPVEVAAADLVVARVAGFDTAVYGLPREGVWPILFEHPKDSLLVATTKLSQFITARYAPAGAWGPIWNRVLVWLSPRETPPPLEWVPAVRPSYGPAAPLPAAPERAAFERGAAWYIRSRMLIHPSWEAKLAQAAAYPDRVGPAPARDLPAGDGSRGLLEGFNARIHYDGSQPVRWWLRNDCMAESSLALALSGTIQKLPERRRIAANLNDFIYFTSPLAQGSRNDPKCPSYGLVGWNTAPKYYKDQDGFGVYYGDDNARAMLGTMGAAALVPSDRWDEPLLRCLLANLRTTGKLGFRGSRLDEAPLQKNGWRYYHEREITHYAPHYEAYPWACFLWAYHQTGHAPFRDLSKNAIRMTMDAYPDRWHWTNGIQQERARMLLPLAWLVRVEDTAEHRGWLERMVREILAFQDSSGAIREELGVAGKGDYGPPKSNEAYGTNEATLIQANGDPLCDLLYTTNFAFLGLHEAAAATGERLYLDASDRLARFLCRIQVRSEVHPELDGSWFRAFEFRRWEYWASNADAGWGAWSIESGWTQSWVTTVLGLRHLRTSLWQMTAASKIRRHLDQLLPVLFPDS
ncbi:MAG TPA: hypothetical protein VFA33_15590 [Bryobacteraceae bacterium]|nr:hypothetical protein [Bryobacteraceae bacterium]